MLRKPYSKFTIRNIGWNCAQKATAKLTAMEYPFTGKTVKSVSGKDMHCDTISRIYQERKQQRTAKLRENSFQVDLAKMKSSGYFLQNFALFIDLGETKNPYQTFLEQFAVFQEEMEQNVRTLDSGGGRSLRRRPCTLTRNL